jgi:hypothetical protein
MVIQNPFYPKSAVETTTILASSKANSDGCRRCRGIVYDAEKMSMRSGVYHRLCFNCAACRRALDYLLAVDSPSKIQFTVFDHLSNSGLLNKICIDTFQVWFVCSRTFIPYHKCILFRSVRFGWWKQKTEGPNRNWLSFWRFKYFFRQQRCVL